MSDSWERAEESAAVVADELAGALVDETAPRHWNRGDTVRVVIAGAALIGGGVAASRGVPSAEAAMFANLNNLMDGLYPVVWPVMQLGNVWVAAAVALVAGGLVRRLP